MDKIRERLEILILYVTLIISLSAFKDELSKIDLSLGYTKITAAQYLLYCVYGFSLCLYLYILEFILSGTRIGKWAGWNWVTRLAFWILITILISPVVVGFNIVVVIVLQTISPRTAHLIQVFGGVLIGAAGGYAGGLIARAIQKSVRTKQQEEIKDREVIELESATKLLQNGFYSHSILESYRALESYLNGELLNQNIRAIRGNTNDLINTAVQNNILERGDISSLNDVRGMRNQAAHSPVEYTKENAEFALNFVRKVLQRRPRV